MNDAMEVTQKVLACGCFVPVFLAFAALTLMANIIGSISPLSIRITEAPEVTSTLPPSPPVGGANDCVFSSLYVKTALSYNGAEDPSSTDGQPHFPSRHGSNYYWAPRDEGGVVRGFKDCEYAIPIFGGDPAKGPLDSASWCYNGGNSTDEWPLRDYYGYALDVRPALDVDNAIVRAPALPGVAMWNVVPNGREVVGVGCSATLYNDVTTGSYSYQIFLGHLDCSDIATYFPTPKQVPPGTGIARLYNYPGGKHTHIELKLDGDYKRPEDYLCK